MKSKALRLATILLACGAFGVTALAAPDSPPAQVNLPCGDSSDSFMRDCATMATEVQQKLEERILQQRNYLYNGVSIDPSNPEHKCTNPADLTTCTGRRFSKPVCSLVANKLSNNMAEETSNHKGDSCGSFFQYRVESGGIHYDAGGQNGDKEAAWRGGAFVHSMSCYLAQVKKEIADNKSIQVHGACQALAEDVSTLGNRSKAVTDSLKTQLGGQLNIKDIKNCKKETWDTSGKKVDLDVGRLRQSAQYLCAARDGIETMFVQLAACEVFHRSGADFRNVFGDATEFEQKVRTNVASVCYDRCSDSCHSRCSAPWGSPSKCKRCATRCANSCYQNELPAYLKRLLNRWPDNGSCPAVSSALPAASGASERRALC